MLEYILVFLGAAVPALEIAIVIPAGIIRGLSPFWVILLAFAGNLLTVLLLILLYQRIEQWYRRRKGEEGDGPSKRQLRGRKIMDKYGVAGLSLAGPILIGTHIAAFFALLFGASKRKTILWMAASIAFWSLVFGIATAMGFSFFVKD
ncbi:MULTISPECIES: small multi-drug export protein [Sporosarcina]|uniref:small multi-drug export protein n=1 Tax=Sporosarcina TaxID=1569 RepID=UPI00058D92A2|nr:MULTISPECIES: small multi-drug export protein [Sporosarcina]WJY27349.1 small multi-drug export protein [Sporosarcina sp. 0.2-SM1T-5]